MGRHEEKEKEGRPKISRSFLSGGLAGVCTTADAVYIVRNNGIRNLWRGNILNICRIFPHAAIVFPSLPLRISLFLIICTIASIKVYHYLHSGNKYHPSVASFVLFLCGATAGMTAITCTTPLDFLRVRMAMERDNFTYTGNWHAFQYVLKHEGVLGFYRGYAATLAGISIYHGSSFFIFARVKEKIRKKAPELYSKWYVDFGLGAVSAIGQLISYPFDVLRKRMQGQHLLKQKGEITAVVGYRFMYHRIVDEEGLIKGFYKGISLNLIKAPLAAATAWTVKNAVNRYLDPAYDF